jgi:thioredoxin 2
MNAKTSEIVRCPACQAANRVPTERMGSAVARCGKCKQPLFPPPGSAAAGETYKIRCLQCGARNRLSGTRVDSAPKCGKCGAPLPAEQLFLPQPIMVTDGNFEAQVLKSPLPVLLFAWAPWCPGCNAAAPIIDQFAADSKGHVRVGKLNVEANPHLAGRYSIMSVPFLYIFERGKLQESLPGGLQKHELMLKMAPYL